MTRPTYLVLGSFLALEWEDLWQRQQEWVANMMVYGNVVYLERAVAGTITPARILGRVRKLAAGAPVRLRHSVTPFPSRPEFVSWMPAPISGRTGWRLNARRALRAANARRLELGWEPFSLVHVGMPSEIWVEAAARAEAPIWFDSAERFLHSSAYVGVPRDMMRRQVAEATLVTTDTELTREDWTSVRDDIAVVPHGAKAWAAPLIPNVERVTPYYVGSHNPALDLHLLSDVASLAHAEVGLVGEFPADSLLPGLFAVGWVAGGDIPRKLSDATVGLVPYRDSAWCRGVFPSKVFDYLLAGAPVVSTRLPALDNMPWVWQVDTAPEAASAMLRASQLSDADRRAIRDYALRNTWNERFRTVVGLLRVKGVSGL